MKHICLISLLLGLGVICAVSQDSIVSIPDDAFLHALIDEVVDTNGDSLISYEEGEAVSKLNVEDRGISDMTGIEAFINLDTLGCNNNEITSLDVSNNNALRLLVCHKNQLNTLDVSKNSALAEIYCSGNQLTSLDLNNNTELKYLQCNNNHLTSLDLSNKRSLRILECAYNQLTNLDLSENSELIVLNCGYNNLKNLTLTNNTELQFLWLNGNSLDNLDLSNNKGLVSKILGSDAFDFYLYYSGVPGGVPNINLSDMPGLSEVCVWDGFVEDSSSVVISVSPNVYFTTDCSK